MSTKKFKFKKFIYALAPMAGVTDFAFREICSQLGADMVVTEMISAKALEYNNKRTQKMLQENATCLKAVQLFGHDSNAVAKVVSSGILDKFDIIDFNSYYTKEVADTVVGILEREQHSYLRLGVYFILQWMAGLIIFITTKRKN